MSIVQVSPDNGAFIGRVNEADLKLPKVTVSFNAIFDGTITDYEVDFTQINTGAQVNVFGVPQGMFIDNSSNESEVEVLITGTDSYFTVPARAEGYFKLDARVNSVVKYSSVGIATDKVTITIYNHPVAPNVWYKFGAFNISLPIKIEGSNITGSDTDTETYNNPVLMGGVTAAGILTRLLTDAAGSLIIDQLPTTVGAKTGALSLSVVPNTNTSFPTREDGYSFSHIAAAATTLVKNGAGLLHTLSISSLGTVASTTTIYDNIVAGGTVIAVIDSLTFKGTLTFDCNFATGLTIVTTGTVAPDVTATYR